MSLEVSSQEKNFNPVTDVDSEVYEGTQVITHSQEESTTGLTTVHPQTAFTSQRIVHSGDGTKDLKNE